MLVKLQIHHIIILFYLFAISTSQQVELSHICPTTIAEDQPRQKAPGHIVMTNYDILRHIIQDILRHTKTY
jgi:hypothetical protein